MHSNSVKFHIYLDHKLDAYILTVTKVMYYNSQPTWDKSNHPYLEFYSKPKVDERQFEITYDWLMVEFMKYKAMAVPAPSDGFNDEQEDLLLRMFYVHFITKEYKNDALVIHEFRKLSKQMKAGEFKISDYPHNEEPLPTFKGTWADGGIMANGNIKVNFIVDKEDYASQLEKYKEAFEASQVAAKEVKGYLTEGYYFKTGGPIKADPNDPSVLSQKLPGVNQVVKHPRISESGCDCYYDSYDEGAGLGKYTIRNLVMHLNDEHRWTREQIADWLETLDVDLSFKIKENEDEVSN